MEVYFKGLNVQKNPGPAAVGFIIKKDGVFVRECSKFIGDATNNQAEFFAVYEALLVLKQMKPKVPSITFYGDSLIVINKLNKILRYDYNKFFETYVECKQLESEIGIPVRYVKIVGNQEAKEVARRSF